MSKNVARSIVRVGLMAAAVCCAAACAAQEKQGYFRVEQRDGVWWFIDPAGAPSVSIGVDAIRYEGDRIKGAGPSPYMNTVASKYATRQAWTKATVDRLRDWGFN